jgi:hypothetical protein
MLTTPLYHRAVGALFALGMAITLAVGIAGSPATAASSTAQLSGPGIPMPSAPVGGVVPLTANTCSGSVCIYVVGSGLSVTSWSTSVIISKAGCSTPKFLDNGSVIRTGPSICGSAGYELEYVWSAPGSFSNNTQLCNTWSGYSGEPCITVHN